MPQEGLVGAAAKYATSFYRAANCCRETVGSGVVKSSDFLKERPGMQSFMCTLLTFKCWQQIQV